MGRPKKLLSEDRDGIRQLVAGGLSQAEVARRAGVAESTVSRTVRGVDRSSPPSKVIPLDVLLAEQERTLTVPQIA